MQEFIEIFKDSFVSNIISIIGIFIAFLTYKKASYISLQQKRFSEQSELRALMLEVYRNVQKISSVFKEYKNNNNKDKCIEIWEMYNAEICNFFDPKYFKNNTKKDAATIQEYRSKISQYLSGMIDEENIYYDICCIEGKIFSIIMSIYRNYPQQTSSH